MGSPRNRIRESAPPGRIAYEDPNGRTVEVEVRSLRAFGLTIRAAHCDVDVEHCLVKSVENGRNVYVAVKDDCVHTGEAVVRP